jgi:hypothetical protein
MQKNNNNEKFKNQIVIKNRTKIDGVDTGDGWKYIIIKSYDKELWNLITDYLIELGLVQRIDYIKLAFKDISTKILYRMFLRVRYSGFHHLSQTYIKFHEKEIIHIKNNHYSKAYRTSTTTAIPDPSIFIEKLEGAIPIEKMRQPK